MTLKKIEQGDIPTGDEWMMNWNELYTLTGLNLIRQLIDRDVDLANAQMDWFGDAYVDADGRMDSVDTGNTTAIHINDKYVSAQEGSTENWNESTNSGDGVPLNFTVTLTTTGYFDKITICSATETALDITISVGAETIVDYSTTTGSDCCVYTINIPLQEYSRLLTSDDIVTIEADAYNITESDSNYSYSGTFFNLSSQKVPGNLSNEDILGFTEFVAGDSIIQHNIPTGKFSSIISKAIGMPLIEDWEDGADIQYKLTNTNNEDSGWLSCSNSPEVSEFTAFSAEPETMIVKLIPKDSNPTAGFPSVKGFLVRGD